MATLYTVATPIGNLGDMTYRAVEVLKAVHYVLCEDTRMTKRLLQHYQITTPTRSYHQHSTVGADDWVIRTLQAGQDLALVSDAGTPGISDPGSRLIQAVVAAGLTVTPIPGASAVITALQAAGVDTAEFSFLGFVPHKKGRQQLFTKVAAADHTMVMYESPHRLLKTLASLAEFDCYVVVARELTKIYEEFVRGNSKTVYEIMQARPSVKGECVVIVSPQHAQLRPETSGDDTGVPR